MIELRAAQVIIVMGVSGTGKSTVGTRLADALEGEFVEADDFHSATPTNGRAVFR